MHATAFHQTLLQRQRIRLCMPQSPSQLYVLLSTLFFSLIICAGLFGNSLFVATLTRWREMRTPCNLLIANICAADLGVYVFPAPLRIIDTYRGWLFGEVMCYILVPLQDVFVVVSVVTQTVIALERHRTIVAPFKRKMTLKRVKTSVLVIWIACYLTAGVPMIIFLKNKLYGNGFYYCFTSFHQQGLSNRIRDVSRGAIHMFASPDSMRSLLRYHPCTQGQR